MCFYYSENVFLVSTSRPFHHSCFHDWKKVLLLFVKICLLAGTGPIINAFTSGRRRLHYSQKIACCAPVPPLTFSRVGESASPSRKKLFSTRAELVPYPLCQQTAYNYNRMNRPCKELFELKTNTNLLLFVYFYNFVGVLRDLI